MKLNYTKLNCSQKHLFNLVFHFLNLAIDWTIWLGKNCYGNDVSWNTTCSSKGRLFWDINVWNIFILAQKWQMKNDLKWFSISSKDNQVSNTSIKGFGCFISSLLQQLEVFGLVHQIENLISHCVVSFWPCSTFFNSVFSFLYRKYHNQS